MDFAHFKTAAQFGRVGVNARLAQRLALYRRLAAKAMAELARERGIPRPASFSREYQQSPAERRVDFAAIKKALDDDQVRVDLALRVPIRKVLGDLIALIKRQDKAGGITDSFVMGITLTTGPEAQRILGDYLLKVWKRGRELAKNELPATVQRGIKEYTCDYCGTIHYHEADTCAHFAFCPTGEGGGIDNSCSPTGEISHGEVLNVGDTVIWNTATGSKEEVNYRGKSGNDVVIVTKDGHQISVPAEKISVLPESHPIMAKKIRAAFRDHLMNTLGQAGGGEVKLRDGSSRILSDNIDPDNKDKYPFRITYIGSDGVPSGHDVLKDWDEVVGNLAGIRKQILEIKTAKHFDKIKSFAGLEPVQAINFFQNLRPWLVKGIIDDELKKSARLELTEHLKGGRTLTETIGNLRSAWEPWIGDPTKVLPSGITGTAEDILQAYRLENIVRTEAITALSQGRAEIADEAGDFVVGFELSPILDVDTHLPLSQTRGSLPCNRIRDLIDMDRPVRFRKDDPRSVKLLPPLLYNCRTIEIFITSDDLPIRWSTEAELDSVVRLIPEGFK